MSTCPLKQVELPGHALLHLFSLAGGDLSVEPCNLLYREQLQASLTEQPGVLQTEGRSQGQANQGSVVLCQGPASQFQKIFLFLFFGEM